MKKHISTGLGIAVLACLAVLPAPGAARAAGGTPTRLVVADAITIHHLNLYVAQELGIFRKHGLDVTINDVRNIALARDQVLSGKADLFWSCPTVAISAIAGGAPLKVISQVKTPCTSQLMVPPSSTIKNWQDLKGKRIAAQSPTCESVLAYDTRARAAHAPFKVVALSGQAALSALEAGKVDGAILEEPDSSRALAKGFKPVLGEADEQASCRTINARTGIIREDPDAVRRLVQAIQEANEVIRKDPKSKELVRIARKYTDVPDGVIRWSGRGSTFTTRLDEKSLRLLGDELVKVKGIRENPGEALFARELKGITWGK
jgi:NitT/TauT family transport system substrate-binding protein